MEQGHVLHMAIPVEKIDWNGCPGPRLAANIDVNYTVAELRKTTCDRWFFRTLIKPTKVTNAGPSSGPQVSQNSAEKGYPKLGAGLAFESFWAPLDATIEGRHISPLFEHLHGKVHRDHEECVASGSKLLVSRAAISVAKKVGEDPAMSLGRFRAGLGLASRFCEPKDVERAEQLQRVRDVNIPVKFLREALPARTDFLWITTDELWEAEDKYEQQRRKRGGKKG